MSKFFLVFMVLSAAISIIGWVVTDISIYAFNTGVLLVAVIDEVMS